MKHTSHTPTFIVSDNEKDKEDLIKHLTLHPIRVVKEHGENAVAFDIEEEVVYNSDKTRVQKIFKYFVRYED